MATVLECIAIPCVLASLTHDERCVELWTVVFGNWKCLRRMAIRLLTGGNKIAHSLAKFGLVVDANCFWLEDFPPCVASEVAGDIPSQL
ncbi:hypothetical protein Q3G72_034571 [Acer saccharum]|nr:hypothetical protein Q3G72_034571 [Acer saccharum]